MTTYVKLTENNEWEGERWHFYIPYQGNQTAIEQLATALAAMNSRFGADEPFVLDLDPLDATEVDVLVKHADADGYMPDHNQLEGALVIPEDKLAELAGGDLDPLYKGRIRDYMRAAA